MFNGADRGTTSAKRPIKNDRFYLNKPVNKADKIVITLLTPNENTELGRKAIALAAKELCACASRCNPGTDYYRQGRLLRQ